MRRFSLSAAALVTACLLPTTASAATFYVDDDAALSNTACSVAEPCATINAAIAKGRLTVGGDVLQVASGTYAAVALTAATDAGDTIRGTGDDTRIEITSPFTTGVAITAPEVTLEGLHVVMNNAAELSNNRTAIAVSAGATGATLDRVHVSGLAGWYGHGIEVRAANASLRDVLVEANGPALDTWYDTTVVRSRLFSPENASYALLIYSDADVSLDSSVVAGGSPAIFVNGYGADDTLVTIRNCTIDSGARGVRDIPRRSIRASNSERLTSVTVNSTIMVEPVEASTGATVSCTFSDAPDQTQVADATHGTITCSHADGNATSEAAEMFLDPTAGDYSLIDASPAIDGGSSDALTAGESATDVTGNARVLDGNRDCAARRDKGAYEFTGGTNLPPVVAIDDPGALAAGINSTFRASVIDEDPAGLGFGWVFGDGGTGSLGSVAHAFAAAGAYDVSVQVTDGCGQRSSASRRVTVAAPSADGAGQPQPQPQNQQTTDDQPVHGTDDERVTRPDDVVPVLRALKLTNTRFRVGKARGGVPSATKLVFGLTEAARVDVVVRQLLPGRRKGPRCLAASKAPRGKPCTRAVGRGGFGAAAAAGANRLAFSGRLRGKALAPGRYRLLVAATDAAGNRSIPQSLRFAVVR